MDDDRGDMLAPGDPHRRAFVGPPATYDVLSHLQFNLLTLLGLREHHSLLDIGCGSLRAGRLFITYLLPGRYCGIEPNQWLIEEAIGKEVGRDLMALKEPRFSHDEDFSCTTFDQEFDFILAQSVFSHASASQIRRCLEEAAACMKPTSIFAATFVEGRDNYEGDTWVYPDVVSYRLDWLRERAAEAGLTCTPVPWAHVNLQKWVVFARPGHTPRVEALTIVNQTAQLELELSTARQRLATEDPVLRLARKVKRLLRR